MNKLAMVLCTGICSTLIVTTGNAQLSGTKIIGAGGDYAAFSAAITALNASGVGAGGIHFQILDGTYTEPTPLTIDITVNKPTESSPVLFKPAPGATVVLNIGGQVTGSRWGLKVGTANNSVDYVTFDGSNAIGGTTRDWTIRSTAETYGIEPIDVSGDYVTIKNCIVDMNPSGYSGSGNGITFRDAAPTAAYGTVLNCKVTGNNAICIGRGTSADMPGFLVGGNEVHSLNRGIYFYRTSAAVIEGNEIIGDASGGYPSGACYGIYTASPSGNVGPIVIRNNIVRNLGSNSGTGAAQTIRGISSSGPGSYTISGNRIYDLFNATNGTGSPIVYAIQVSSGASTSSYEIFNNFVSGLRDNDPDTSISAFTYGIHYTTSGNASIVHNSVCIEESARDRLCAALQLAGGNASNTVTVKNNVLINRNTSAVYPSYAIYRSATLLSTLESNFNNLFVDGATKAFVGFAGGDQATLLEWQTASSQDANSRSVAVTFASATDLHISGPSDGDPNLVGTPIPSVTTDIDGQARSAAYPYLGADEAATALPVQLTSFSADASAQGVILRWTTATETDCYGFDIERRIIHDMDWLRIAFVAGAGNSSSPREYAYLDNAVTPGRYVYRLKQVDHIGWFEYFGNAEIEIGVAPKQILLGENFPNPFNGQTVISYSVPEAERPLSRQETGGSPATPFGEGRSFISLRIYDVLGREVALLVDGEKAAGRYTAAWNASGMSSGIYFCSFSAGGFTQTRKMMLVR